MQKKDAGRREKNSEKVSDIPTRNNSEQTARAHRQADRDMQDDERLSPDPNDEPDRDETARLRDENGLI